MGVLADRHGERWVFGVADTSFRPARYHMEITISPYMHTSDAFVRYTDLDSTLSSKNSKRCPSWWMAKKDKMPNMAQNGSRAKYSTNLWGNLLVQRPSPQNKSNIYLKKSSAKIYKIWDKISLCCLNIFLMACTEFNWFCLLPTEDQKTIENKLKFDEWCKIKNPCYTTRFNFK